MPATQSVGALLVFAPIHVPAYCSTQPGCVMSMAGCRLQRCSAESSPTSQRGLQQICCRSRESNGLPPHDAISCRPASVLACVAARPLPRRCSGLARCHMTPMLPLKERACLQHEVLASELCLSCAQTHTSVCSTHLSCVTSMIGCLPQQQQQPIMLVREQTCL